ncbi:phage tail tape measure protein [Thermogemmata fonticola]|uniref:Phage tail tape measure protein n=1 Tax=Thermogemmata fonticola TaxID=2755323 RepID=A0A7V8VAR0_9BACT|nr:phage tail tape measure protein [Thermogemmata fonticola]MBA2224578.1 phage tail tape measure protein [Thermogemmata fonticola]
MATASGIRAGAAYVELFVKDSRLVKGLNVTVAKLKAFGAAVTALGAKLTGLGVTLAAPLFGAVKLFSDLGGDMKDLSDRTGVAVEALSQLRYAAEQSGASTDDLEKALRTMSRNIIEAARGSAQAQRSLGRLGLTIADLTGLSPDQQFELIADRLSRIQNPAHRATLAMEIFGRTGANLLPLLSSGAEGIRELRDEADRLGLTMRTEDAAAAEAFGDALDALWKALKQAAFSVGAALAPAIQQVAQWITRVVTLIGGWLQENRALIRIIGAVVAGIVGVGATLLVLGPLLSAIGSAIGLVTFALSAATTAVSLLGGAIAFLLSPIGLVVAAVGGIAAAVLFATDEGKMALDALGQGFHQLLGVASTTWQSIQDAIAAGDLAGAMEVAWLGIHVVWETGIAAITRAWRNFKSFFVELFWSAVYAVARAFNTAWTSIEVAFWTVVNALADGWDWFVYGLTVAFNEFVAFFRRAWARVRNLFNREAAQREVEAINREVEEQNREARARLDRRVRERAPRVEQAREAGRQREEALNQMQEEERRQRQRELEAANAADQERVAAAQRALEQRAAELAAQREQMELERQMAAMEREEPLRRRPEFDLEGLDEAEAKTDVKGTFSAFAVAGLGSDSLAERTARASEQIAKNTDKLVREAQNGGLVFA